MSPFTVIIGNYPEILQLSLIWDRAAVLPFNIVILYTFGDLSSFLYSQYLEWLIRIVIA
jgi:hypothetical protein